MNYSNILLLCNYDLTYIQVLNKFVKNNVINCKSWITFKLKKLPPNIPIHVQNNLMSSAVFINNIYRELYPIEIYLFYIYFK